jgi:putative acetyltransferase
MTPPSPPIIRTVMPEYGATGDGFAINDPEVDWMHRPIRFRAARISWSSSKARLSAAAACPRWRAATRHPASCARCTSSSTSAARAIGSEMLRRCLEAARFRSGFRSLLPGNAQRHETTAIRLYERHGFKRIGAPRGQTGHGGCNTFYLREL